MRCQATGTFSCHFDAGTLITWILIPSGSTHRQTGSPAFVVATGSGNSSRRLVMRKLVVRFEMYTNGGWQLWKSFSFLHDFDDALGALDKPGKGFAKRSWFA